MCKPVYKNSFQNVHYCWGVILVNIRDSHDPYFNLAAEEYLVRHQVLGPEDFLLLYINEPCIVLGKNQSIYKEVNFDFLRKDTLKIARRISGGGTVYQDRGNLNFAFISRFEEFKINNYSHFNQPVVHALNKTGIAAVMDARNNLLLHERKISGNSQFTDRKNLISHGTLLVNADLTILRHSLKENPFAIETKAVASVKSAVMNIAEQSKRMTTAEVMRDYLLDELPITTTVDFTDKEWREIAELAKVKFQSHEWIYGRSPKTVIKKEGCEIEIVNGYIENIQTTYMDINAVTEKLKGIAFTFESIKKALENMPNASSLISLIF